MGRRPSRGNTKTQKAESYRIQAIDYVNGRDAKIDEICADIKVKYPRMADTEIRRIVVEHWAAMERAKDVNNTVRSLDFGYDERAMLGRLNSKLNSRPRSKLPDRLPDALSGAREAIEVRSRPRLQDATDIDVTTEDVLTVLAASASISAVSGKDPDNVRHTIYQIATSGRRP